MVSAEAVGTIATVAAMTKVKIESLLRTIVSPSGQFV
jgi:hypothetical protein